MLIRVKSISCVDDSHHKGGAAAGVIRPSNGNSLDLMADIQF
jgi:hypothetical protein